MAKHSPSLTFHSMLIPFYISFTVLMITFLSDCRMEIICQPILKRFNSTSVFTLRYLSKACQKEQEMCASQNTHVYINQQTV